MNCANHVDVPATAYCRTCGKPVCAICARDVRGVIYCEDCLASQISGTMPPQPPIEAAMPGTTAAGGSPGVAAVLGLIPGVGAIYNGEYTKAFVHVGIFAALIALTAHGYWPFAFGIGVFYLYMPFEAYQTAKARQMGLQPPDPFGLNNLFTTRPPMAAGAVPPAGVVPQGMPAVAMQPDQEAAGEDQIPIGAFVLIGIGVLFLLNTFGWMHFDWLWRLWPLVLIAIGVRVLMKRNRMGY
jgi:hypothetical protein